mgnify:CR=1 FL=1
MLSYVTTAYGQKNSERVLFTVDETPVTKGEFKYVYQKNNKPEAGYSENDVRDYLELYTNFKLKVKAARQQGLDTTKSFRKEFNQYRDQLAAPYLRDQEATQELVREAYSRMKDEIRVRHILISLEENAPPKDTLRAYRLADSLRQAALNGSDFGELATQYSDDPSVEKNQGDLGYFTAFQMIYPFESAAYKLEKGTISKPVRTRFGYHIIKLINRRPNQGKVEVAHLMIRPEKSESGANDREARQKIDSLYQALQNGADFEKLVMEYSSDRASAKQGGKVRPFSASSRFIPEKFRETAFGLKEEGNISKPVKTSYGFHIIKLLERKPIASFSEMEEEIRRKVKRDARAEKSKEAAIRKFKKQNNFRRKNGLEGFGKYADTSLLNGDYQAPKTFKQGWFIFKRNDNQVMFSMEESRYRFRDFAQYLEENQKAGKYEHVDVALDSYYQQFVKASVLDYQKARLKDRHPEYRRLVQEYEEGILLYDIMNRKVWEKAAKDSAGQLAFYEQNPELFETERKRLDVGIYTCANEKLLKAFRTQLNRKLEKPQPAFVAQFNEAHPVENGQAVSFQQDTIVMGKTPYYPDTVAPKGLLVEPGKVGGKPILVKVDQVLPRAPKPFEEVRGRVISAYQDALEKEWLESLRAKYPVKVDEETLEQTIEELTRQP